MKEILQVLINQLNNEPVIFSLTVVSFLVFLTFFIPFTRKKLHWLVLRAFIGPFLVIFSVLVLIFLVRFVLMYIDEISGKGLEIAIYLELFFYFSFNSIPMILPLAVLFASLMTYGNFGQHNELTAVKSAGVSLVRILTPVFVFSVLVSGLSFYLNNNLIPVVNLKAYSLLWDIKHKKAAFNLKEGVFYNEIPGYSIKVNDIGEDGKTLRDVVIYEHQDKHKGNITNIFADSGYMELVNDETLLNFELYNGKRNSEYTEDNKAKSDDYTRTDFSYTKMVFDLTSFQLDDTPEELFKGNRQMMNVDILEYHVDSFKLEETVVKDKFKDDFLIFFRYGLIQDTVIPFSDSLVTIESYDTAKVLLNAHSRAKNMAYQVNRYLGKVESKLYMQDTFDVEKKHKYVQAVACIIMFLIGAPIGAVIKKGGMGAPGMITIVFFILYYVIYITFEKYARAHQLETLTGSWGSIFVLLPFGLLFVFAAARDSKIFEGVGLFISKIGAVFQRLKRKPTSIT